MEERIQYYVEGEDEKKLLQVLKTDMQLIRPGKIQVFNVASKAITRARLLTLNQDTVIVAVFDTDVVDQEILRKNIQVMNEMANVKKVVTVLQVKNLEDELVRCCNIRNAEELVNARNKGEFKSSFIKTTNLNNILKKNGFDIAKLWKMDDATLIDIHNEGKWVKRVE